MRRAIIFVNHPALAIAVFDCDLNQLDLLFRSNGKTRWTFTGVAPEVMDLLLGLPIEETSAFLAELKEGEHSVGYVRYSLMSDRVFEAALFGVNA